MANAKKRPLKAFLCHASGDKPQVHELYKQLTTEGVDAWLDQEKLLPGQDWRLEIPRAVHEADVVVICLSKRSITKEGYVQKEIKFALDIAEEKPEGAIFLIPARLEECVVPEGLERWQWVNLYEENGFIKLLRSLKLRADAVGAMIEPTFYADTEKEINHRLEQLYTEGLAAFYTEDWDKACRRFRTILSEQPNYRKAAEKLAEAECQRDLARLYAQATEAYHSENWQTAISAFDELSQKSADYRDAAQLLRDARKQKQLKDLYAEARALHAAQKWQAVVKVFKQISVIEPNYPDTEGLLTSAQREVIELERLARLEEQYNHALHEMEAGNWYGAREALEGIHKSQTGFLETEKLLRKVENEISREEEKRKQNDQINTLYEQAQGLLRAKKWHNALDKLEEIRKLDRYFSDVNGIAEKAKAELEQEEQETQKQNQLAAMYAEAVRLLREEKYQEALDHWQNVKSIDPKYPDHQRVQRTARKKLAGIVQQRVVIQPQLSAQKAGVGWFVLLGGIGFGLARLALQNLGVLFRFDFPLEVEWGLRGVLDGVITVLILRTIDREWEWKAFLTFGICWAIVYVVLAVVVLDQQILLLASLTFSLAPVLSVLLLSLWTKQREQWQTYALIFAGWLFAWVIGQSVATYLDPVLRGAVIRWAIGDALTGGIGLWITVDLIKSRTGEQTLEDSSDIAMKPALGSAKLLLLAALSTVVIRAIWGVFQDWFHIWDAEIPTLAQFSSLFVLGGCYGTVVALCIERITSGWRWQHSLTIIISWACGLGSAVLASGVDLGLLASFMPLLGISVAAAIQWARPSIAPLKFALIFLCWTLAWKYGSTLYSYMKITLSTGYVACVTDAITVLFGLLATLGILEYSSKRLVTLTFMSAIGFALGDYVGTALTRILSINLLAEIQLQYALLGFIGGAVFELPSRNPKKILIRGGLCAAAGIVGHFSAPLLSPSNLILRGISYGMWFGIAFGLSTRRIPNVIFLAVLGSAIFTITSLYMVMLHVPIMAESIIRGTLIGLVLGFGYAYVTRDAETVDSN
jgi:outer membrane protein assembly factor BamD (BamD/ComL family)